MQFVIVSGLSGAGKSKTASYLEDIGFYVVDNMPAESLIPQFAQLCLATKGRYEQVALVTDVRGSLTFDGLFKALEDLDRMNLTYTILFVEAADDVILKRYKETRRTHPLTRNGADLREAMARERELLAPIRNRANAILDTSALSTAKLGEVLDLVAGDKKDRAMTVSVVSFGFKYGLPMEADLVFDVRFLPNPYYILELRPQTGLDEPVREFVFSYQQTRDFVEKVEDLLAYCLPAYVDEGKTGLVIAVGCTGGKHRSVAVAQELGEFVAKKGYITNIGHRDMNRR